MKLGVELLYRNFWIRRELSENRRQVAVSHFGPYFLTGVGPTLRHSTPNVSTQCRRALVSSVNIGTVEGTLQLWAAVKCCSRFLNFGRLL